MEWIDWSQVIGVNTGEWSNDYQDWKAVLLFSDGEEMATEYFVKDALILVERAQNVP